MRLIPSIASLAIAGGLSLSPAFAESQMGPAYSAGDLLAPCQEADNDARWGETAELECEQYVLGFADGLSVAGALGSEICLPEVNMTDEVRWAFMRWVHGSYTERKAMPASEALLATMKEAFACAN